MIVVVLDEKSVQQLERLREHLPELSDEESLVRGLYELDSARKAATSP